MLNGSMNQPCKRIVKIFTHPACHMGMVDKQEKCTTDFKTCPLSKSTCQGIRTVFRLT